MAYFKLNIEVLVDVEDEAQAIDAIAETLREQLHEFNDESCIIDWRFTHPGTAPEPHDGSGFEYAERISERPAGPKPRFDFENACPTCGPTCCC